MKTAKGKVFKYSDRKLKDNFNELEKLCGFRILLKDLRTTFATRLREKGVNEEVIATVEEETTETEEEKNEEVETEENDDNTEEEKNE